MLIKMSRELETDWKSKRNSMNSLRHGKQVQCGTGEERRQELFHRLLLRFLIVSWRKTMMQLKEEKQCFFLRLGQLSAMGISLSFHQPPSVKVFTLSHHVIFLLYSTWLYTHIATDNASHSIIAYSHPSTVFLDTDRLFFESRHNKRCKFRGLFLQLSYN